MKKIYILLIAVLLSTAVSHAQITGFTVTGTTVSWMEDGASPCGTPLYYRIDVGSNVGGSDFGTSGIVSAASLGSSPSIDLDMGLGSIALPTDGSVVNVRLWHFSSCGWRTVDTTLTTNTVTPPMTLPVALVSPACGDPIGTGDVTVSWTPGDVTVFYWRITIGTSPGGSDIAFSGILSSATTSFMTSIDGEGLATAGIMTLYLRLWHFVPGSGWKILDCSSAVSGGGGPGPSCIVDGSDSGPGTLRQAVLDASADDTICLDTDVALTSDHIVIDKDLTIDGNGNTIDGSGFVRIFHVVSGVTLTLTDVTLTGGAGIGGALSPSGGAIYNEGTLLVSDSTFTGNSSVATTGGGGGIYNEGTCTVTTSMFSSNTATSATYSFPTQLDGGGAIFNHDGGSLTVSLCTFSGNSASSGGAINSQPSTTFSLTTSTFDSNLTSGSFGGGGAVLMYDPGVISRCTFRSNAGQSGGAVVAFNSTVSGFPSTPAEIQNCTFTLNTAVGGGTPAGGGIFNATHMRVRSCTIVGNTASIGGGFHAGGPGPGLSSRFKNTLLFGNSAGNGDDISEFSQFTVSDEGFNFVGDRETDSVPGLGSASWGGPAFPSPKANGTFVGTGSPAISISISTLGANGGPTETMLPGPSEVTVNAGDSDFSEDQRGTSRPQGAQDDIGAVEQ